MTPETTEQGTPNWADCATTDLGAAEAFYASVFGWTAERVIGSDGTEYSVQSLGGKMVAGIYALNEEMVRMGVPPHWGTYVEVADVEATLDAVRSEGGEVLDGPSDEPGIGRIALIRDPVGAYLRVWRSEPPHGAQVFDLPGAMTWNELSTAEPEKAASFYERVFGLEVETTEHPVHYTSLKIDGRAVAGILKTTPEMGDFPPSWDVYFACDDADATAESVVAAGGKAIRAAFDIPGVGRMAVLQDPHGAVFEVIAMTMPAG